MRKKNVQFAVTLFLLTGIFGVCHAQWNVQPAEPLYEYSSGESFVVEIRLSGSGEDIATLGFDFLYPDTLLTFDSSDFTGALLENWTFKDVDTSTAGLVRVGGFTVTDIITGSVEGALVFLTFTIKENILGEGIFTLSGLVDGLATATTGSAVVNAIEKRLIEIDAQKDAWYEQLAGPHDGMITLPAAVCNNNGEPDNQADLSAQLWSAWDDTYFYLYEEVVDDVVHVNDPDNAWQNDCIEIKIDADPSAMATENVLATRLTALGEAEAQGGRWDNLFGENGLSDGSTDDFARRTTDDGYVLECRIKWANMVHSDGRGPVIPAVGNTFGLALQNHDNDSNNREASIAWAAVMDDAVWLNPQMLGTVEFLENNMLKYTAQNAIDESAVNNLAELYEPNTLPKPWLTLDIGDVGPQGSAMENNGTWNVVGSGADIWGVEDAFRFAFQVFKGDIDIEAQITGLTQSDPWTKGLLMIRDELTADSKHAIMAIASENGEAFQYRAEKGGESENISGTTEATTPTWLKLQRIGDLFQGWTSSDGVGWDKIGVIEIPMSEQIYVGLAVTSHENTLLSTATFTNVQISPPPINDVHSRIVEVPTDFSLSQNYPNPFNPLTTIDFALPTECRVHLAVFDVLGHEIETLVDERLAAGRHSVIFDAAQYPSGLYLYRLDYGDRILQKKMMLIK